MQSVKDCLSLSKFALPFIIIHYALDLRLSMATLLSVKNLKTHFHSGGRTVRALDGVSFDIEEGEVFGLVGETGCGKSVTALFDSKAHPSSPGQDRGRRNHFRGRDLLRLPEDEMRSVRGKEISMIFQEPMTSLNPVFPHRGPDDGGDHAPPETGPGHRPSKRRSRCSTGYISPMPGGSIKQFPHQLSGGMRQRVMIAMELSCHPFLLIADEPTTALDVTIQAQILRLIKEIKKEFHTSILLITHDLGVVAEICDRVAVMYAGSIVEQAGVEEIFDHPEHPYTQGLWGAIPLHRSGKRDLDRHPGKRPDLSRPPAGCKFHPRCPSRFAPCDQAAPPLFLTSPGHLFPVFFMGGQGR